MKTYRGWEYEQKRADWWTTARVTNKLIHAKTEQELIQAIDEFEKLSEMNKRGAETRRQTQKWQDKRRIAIPIKIKKLEDEIQKLKNELESLK